MNKLKIDSKLMADVNSLSKVDIAKQVLLISNNFDQTKQRLTKLKLQFTPHRFANCFSLNLNFNIIQKLSDYDDVNFIRHNNLIHLSPFLGTENLAFNDKKLIIKNKDYRSNVKTKSLRKDATQTEKFSEGIYLGRGVTICVIDTGIFPHFDFIFPTNRIIKFIDLIGHKKHAYDDNGHGTFVCGIACGNGTILHDLPGYAPNANVIVIKALDSNGNGDANTILDAMQWIYENHKAYKISIICMSFGAEINDQSDPLGRGAEALWKRGITVVVAGGNSGPKRNSIKSPGVSPSIITVGGLDEENMRVADFSSRGPTLYGHKPDLLAPAVNIMSCSSSEPFYNSMSGTSVATPIVAGICACIKSKYPNISNTNLKKFLLQNTKKIDGSIDDIGAGFLCFENYNLKSTE